MMWTSLRMMAPAPARRGFRSFPRRVHFVHFVHVVRSVHYFGDQFALSPSTPVAPTHTLTHPRTSAW